MGRRRRMQEAEEAQARCVRRRRLRLWGLFLLLSAAALGALWLLRSAPAREEERLIRLAAGRGRFFFGVHSDDVDFSVVEPPLDAAFREARSRGQRVVFIEEMGEIGILQNAATGKDLPASVFLREVERDPARMEAWYHRVLSERPHPGASLKRGESYPPNAYGGVFGSWDKARDSFLIRNRDLLEDVVQEALAWPDYLAAMRRDDLEKTAIQAYREGAPERAEGLLRESILLRDGIQESRDRNLLLQMGGLLKGREDLVAVTVRGVGHWGMAGRYALARAWRPEWETVLGEAYGVAVTDMRRFMGKPLSAEEERRRILLQILGRLVEARLRGSGRTPREAVRQAKAVADNPALDPSRLIELSRALGRAGREKALDEAGACGFACDWLKDRGFLP